MQMAAVKKTRVAFAVLVAALAMIAMMFTASAQASGSVTINPNDPHATTITLRDAAKVDISKVKVRAGYVGEWVLVSKASVNHKRCVWTKNGQRWTNSASGVGFYPEKTRAKLCKSSQSSTGWVKVAGGRTGSPCYNPAIPPKKKQPKLKWKKVLDVKSLHSFSFPVNAEASAEIDLQATINCPSSSFVIGLRATAGSRARGFYKVSIDSSILLKSKGKVNGRVKAAIKHALALDLIAKAAAKASGQVTYKCGGGVTPPPQCPSGTIGTWPNCVPPGDKSILILSMTDLNDIPTGKSSGPYYVEVSASDPGGSLAVDPGIGSITDCNGGSRQGSMTVAVPKGITKFCFIIWAPSDPARPTSMTITATAILGSLVDRKVDNLLITYPIRP